MIGSPNERRQFARYVFVGSINTVITYALLMLAMRWIEYLAAYTVAYALGIMIGYWLQSRFVFRVPIVWRTALKFPLVYAVQYTLGVILLWFLVDLARVSPPLAALVVVSATVPLGFFLSRLLLTWRRPTRNLSHHDPGAR